VLRCCLAFILVLAAPPGFAQGASTANSPDEAAGLVLAGKVSLVEGDVRLRVESRELLAALTFLCGPFLLGRFVPLLLL
jgi:hypothetical protein